MSGRVGRGVIELEMLRDGALAARPRKSSREIGQLSSFMSVLSGFAAVGSTSADVDRWIYISLSQEDDFG